MRGVVSGELGDMYKETTVYPLQCTLKSKYCKVTVRFALLCYSIMHCSQ